LARRSIQLAALDVHLSRGRGTRSPGIGRDAGCIEVGKSGDFIVLDQDILKLADEGRADDIRNTAVLETWFMGKPIYHNEERNRRAERGLTK